MAAANAILRSKRAKQLIKKESFERSNPNQDDSDSSASSSPTKSLVLNVESVKCEDSFGMYIALNCTIDACHIVGTSKSSKEAIFTR